MPQPPTKVNLSFSSFWAFRFCKVQITMIATMACSGFLFFFFFFFFFSAIIMHLSLITAQPPIYRNHYCLNKCNYTANSTFQANLNLTLSSLIANATRGDGFYNASTGRSPDRAYGLFQCRGDISPQLCQSYIKTSSEMIISLCPYQKEAIIWYDVCMLRYANRTIFAVMEQSPGIHLLNENNSTDVGPFNATLGSLMDRLVTRAVNGSSSSMFASEDENFTPSKKIYGLVQCTPDITPFDCKACLSKSVGEIFTCCGGKQGGNVLKPSCNLRYESYPFYGSSVAAAPGPSPPTSLPAPPSPATSTNTSDNRSGTSPTVVIIVVPTVILLTLMGLTCAYFFMMRPKKHVQNEDASKEVKSLQFNLSTIRAATNDFSNDNKLGQGGFGSVYKGRLVDGQEIAVKRLKQCSAQGEVEFKNEIVLMARLQHKNLVRLLGFCLEGRERLLIYEFVPNASLDLFIFDPIKRLLLDWERCYKIISSIARGILYLHEESRLKIIHRDLKASNVLLDGEMNPKILDFGMARLFVVDQSKSITRRIVGTYGYMAPKYANKGIISVKTDVFCFGVLILEIVSDKKNGVISNSGNVEHLLSHAWKLWKAGKALSLMDPTLKGSSRTSEIMRCIHIGLLCVQKSVAKRPTMASIVLMLSSYSLNLPLPSQPAFLMDGSIKPPMPLLEHISRVTKSDQSLSHPVHSSVNEVSITELFPR